MIEEQDMGISHLYALQLLNKKTAENN